MTKYYLTVIILFLVSCQSKKDFVDLIDVKQGMTKREVINLIGEPTGKSDDGNRWYYSKETNVVLFTNGVVSSVVLDYTTGLYDKEGKSSSDEVYEYSLVEQLTAEKTNVKVSIEGQDFDVITNSLATLEKDGRVCIRAGSDKAGYQLMIFLDKGRNYNGRVILSTPKEDMASASVYRTYTRELKEIEEISVNTTTFALGTRVAVRFFLTDVSFNDRPIALEGVVVNELLEPF